MGDRRIGDGRWEMGRWEMERTGKLIRHSLFIIHNSAAWQRLSLAARSICGQQGCEDGDGGLLLRHQRRC